MAEAFRLLGASERVAGGANTSGTGQQLVNSMVMSTMPSMALGLASGSPLPAIAQGVGNFVLPSLAAKFTTSPTGVNTLANMATYGTVVPSLETLVSPEVLRAFGQTLAAQP